MQQLIVLFSVGIILSCFSKSFFVKFIHEGFNLVAKSFGFNSIESMVSYTILIINKSTTITVLITSITLSFTGFIESWIFSPIYTYGVFISLMLAEAILGTLKAIVKDKEKFNFDKFVRIIPKFLAHTFALSSAFHMAKAEELFSWMPSTIFIFFGIQNFMKCILHLVDLKVLDGSFANFMRDKFSQNNEIKPAQYEDKPSGDQPAS